MEMVLYNHIYGSGRSKGDTRDACPPGGPNSFNFMQFSGKYGKIVCWCPLGNWRPLLREIPDLPLYGKQVVFSSLN